VGVSIDMVQVRVLGPVQFCIGSEVVDVGPPQRCLVVAALAADAGRLVSQETLLSRVWGPSLPRQAWRTVQAHIATVRGLLKRADASGQAAVMLMRRRGGYVLDVDPDLVDVHRMRRLVARAGDARRVATEQLALWREAVGLWAGEPLAGLRGEWVAQARQAWYGEYRDATLGWAHAEIEAGNPTAVFGRLNDLIGRYPLVEALPAMLMRALYAAGRRTEALACYAASRQRLDEELAEKPGPELQAVYHAVLRREADLPPPSPGLPAGSAVPAQLPADLRGFAGRADQLAQLDAIAATLGHEPTAVVISAIAGTAGVGKTTLAVRWAHRAARSFPDGQLYVNLRGFDPDGSVVDPAEAIRGFLDALAIPPERIPAGREAQAALYRTLLADKRMLILLDNARDTAQVRPLLPGAPGCLVLVTSRDRLTSLVAATGAHALAVDLLTDDEARDLLTRRLGARRVDAEPDAADTLISRCARLPLALAIVAARAATHPHLPLADLAAELAEDRLNALADIDPSIDVRTVFSWSYTTLTPPAARLFRLLGLHPGPDTSAAAAASLAGLPPSEVRPLLTELTTAHLIVEPTPGRYTLHDLLRTYAAELVHRIDLADQHHAATRRILDHYLHTAHHASLLLHPTRDRIALIEARAGITPEHLTNYEQALAWFTTEHPVLLAAVNHAAAIGLDTYTWQLAWVVADFLYRRGHWHDVVVTQHAAVAAAERLADPAAAALTHRFLARAYAFLGCHDDAHTHLRHALDRSDRAGDQVGLAHSHTDLAFLYARLGRHIDALHHSEQALDLFTTAGHRAGQASALNSAGWFYSQLGDQQKALRYCQQALSLLHELGDQRGQAGTWDSLGYIHHHLGHHTQAIACFQDAIDLYHHLGDRYGLAETLTHLGDTHHTVGETEAARTVWQQAIAILDQLHPPDADELRTKLDRLDQLHV
jgi:DNA-binding SARP family transcriptional activator/tetratricopeptide (TPR) repeat protein